MISIPTPCLPITRRFGALLMSSAEMIFRKTAGANRIEAGCRERSPQRTLLRLDVDWKDHWRTSSATDCALAPGVLRIGIPRASQASWSMISIPTQVRKEHCSGLMLTGKTIGVIGMGSIGLAVAQMFQRTSLPTACFDTIGPSCLATARVKARTSSATDCALAPVTGVRKQARFSFARRSSPPRTSIAPRICV
jgi:hypothetical protein